MIRRRLLVTAQTQENTDGAEHAMILKVSLLGRIKKGTVLTQPQGI